VSEFKPLPRPRLRRPSAPASASAAYSYAAPAPAPAPTPYIHPVASIPAARGLHSSTFSAQRKHILSDTLVGVTLSVTNTAQVELKSGRVSAPTSRHRRLLR